MDKCCRTCQHFRLGRCQVFNQLFKINPADQINTLVSNGDVLKDVSEVLATEIPDAKPERVEFVTNRIIRVLKYNEDRADIQPEAQIRDHNSFYCSKYE